MPPIDYVMMRPVYDYIKMVWGIGSM